MDAFKGVEIGQFRLKEGVSEAEMMAAAETMRAAALSPQTGFVAHKTVALGDGLYLDMALGEDQAAVERICASWAGNPHCEAFLALVEPVADSMKFGTVLAAG